jgi:hypothetical protein
MLGLSCSTPGANRRDRLVICTGVSVRNGRLTLAGHKWRPRHMEHTEPLAICNCLRYVPEFLQHITGLLCQLHLGCFFAAPPHAAMTSCGFAMTTVHINPGKP